MLRRRWTLLTAALAILAGYLLSVANIRLGDLNQDEGWYLLAARSVSEGRLPYRDYAFTQGPMLPLVYSTATPLVAKFGVAGGRIFSAWLGLAAALFATYLAGRIAPTRHQHVARAIALTLIAVNVYHSYFTSIVKTYSLCAFFLAAGFFALSFITGRRGWLAAAIAGFLLAAAAGTRISSGAALAVTGLVLLFRRKSLGDTVWLLFGVGGVAGLATVLLPWLFIAPEGFKFGVFEYHTMRSAGGLLPALVYKAGFISRLAQGYLIAFLAGLALLAWTAAFPTLGRTRTKEFQSLEKFDDDAWSDPSDSMLSFLRLDVGREISERLQQSHPVATSIWLSVLAITLVHLSAPFPYDDYQTPLFPLFAAALSAAMVRALSLRFEASNVPVGNRTAATMPRACGWLLASVFLGSVLAAGSSPMNMDWFVRGRDRIWWRMKDEPALSKLHRVADEVRREFPDARTLLTQDAYLAVEAGMQVPPGLDMGPFSYFPDFSDERARVLHVLNRAGLRALLQTAQAPVAAMSGYGLCISCPAVSELPSSEQQELRTLLEARYAPLRTVRGFGQGSTDLVLYGLRTTEAVP